MFPGGRCIDSGCQQKSPYAVALYASPATVERGPAGVELAKRPAPTGGAPYLRPLKTAIEESLLKRVPNATPSEGTLTYGVVVIAVPWSCISRIAIPIEGGVLLFYFLYSIFDYFV
jgi:hypothetical protein